MKYLGAALFGVLAVAATLVGTYLLPLYGLGLLVFPVAAPLWVFFVYFLIRDLRP